MAKLLNKDPITYQKERDSFLRELRQFHDSRGTPLRRVPKVHGHEVDLYLLYVLVTAHGGWEKVNSRCEWDSLSEQFGVPRNCVNGGIALKQIYIRFLERYEKLHFLGEGLDRDDDDDEGEGSRRKWSARVLHSVPLAYNHHQHNVSDQARQTMGLSTDLYKGSEYDRLALSLVCPLPNEHDFAMNVCTLLSNEGKHTLRLEKCPRLVDFLLAHAGVYNHDSLRDVFKDMFKHMRHQSMDQFWCDIVEGVNCRQLTEPPCKKPQVSSTPAPPTSPPILLPEPSDERLQDSLSSAPQDTISDSAVEVPRTQENDNNDCEMVDISEEKVDKDKEIKPKIRMIDVAEEDMPTLPVVEAKPLFDLPNPENEQDRIFTLEDRELFCLGRGLGTQDPLAQRIIQVATIMRNLSFEEDNIPVLGRNATFIRFSLLCMQSQYSCLSQLGMDMLSQVAGEMVLEDPQSDKLVALLVNTVTQGLSSPDRFMALSCLDVLNKLCQNEGNEEVMLKCLEQKVYEQVCSFLTLHDIMLLIYTLECLYSLSSLGEKACNSIVRVHGAIDTLVSLITVEAQSYGPRACILMRVVERLPDQAAQQSSTSGTAVGTMSTLGTQTTTLTPMTNVTPVTPARQPVTIVSRPANATPHRQVLGTPVAVVAQSSSGIPTLVQSPQQLQQQHLQQQQLQENEQFALAWLRATYELSSGHSVEQTELYRQYLASCAKIGRRGVIASLHFPRCVRSVFGGTVGPIAKQPVTLGTTPEYHYDGIKVRKSAVPLLAAPSNQANVPVQIRQPSTPTPPPAPESPAPSVTAEPLPPSISPILKAQLSAPPKQRETTKPEAKSQVLAHPHLTQALLGSTSQQAASQPSQQSQGSNPSTSGCSPTPSGSTTNPTPSTSSTSTSLIKSLLASKVNPVAGESMSMPTASTTTTTTSDVQQHQVAQRQQQQRLLQQQLQSGQQLQPPTPILPPPSPQNLPPLQLITTKTSVKPAILRPVAEPKGRQVARVNGARSLQTANSATTQSEPTKDNSKTEVKENHILPPPPPRPRLDEDSNSAASTANSLVSSSGAVSTDGDGENSLTSFEGILLNGIPNPLDIDAANDTTSNDGSRSCDSSKGSSLKMKGMLADLLEKKVVTKEPVINGVVGKELRISDKGLELVENHVDKILKQENDVSKTETAEQIKLGLKRSATSVSDTPDAKKPLLNPPINGNAHSSEVNDNEIKVEEKPEPVKQEMTPATAVRQLLLAQAANTESCSNQQGGQQQLIVGPRQIIVTPGSLPQGQMMISQNQLGKGQIIVQPGQRQVLVQNPQMLVSTGQMMSQPVLVSSQSGGSQFIVTQALQGAIGATGQTYMLAQSQGLVQGQAPTVLVTQTPQQQGTNAKTIIILHQQGGQKMMTQQGQQVMLQLPRTAVTGNALQGLTLSQGADGQMTVTLPGNSKATNILQVPRTISTVTPGRPVATSAIVANPAKKMQLVTNIVTSSIQSKPTTTSSTSVPPRPSTPRTPGAEGDARNTNSPAPSTSATPQNQKPAVEIPLSPFLCEWRGCMRSFKSANEVYMHACQTHCPTGSEDVQCLWERCDAMKRKRFSLMTHLYDRHCNSDVLRMMAVRRKQMAQSGRSEIPPPAPPPPHPGYAPNAALHAIKRHALEFVNPKELMQRAAAAPPSSSSTCRSGSTPAVAPPPAPSRPPTTGPSPAEQNAEASAARRLSFQDDNEGPVTKSIRLTSSLILRNLVIYSTNGRRFLRSYEPHLASVALSNVESSRTIAQVLYDMSQRPEQS